MARVAVCPRGRVVGLTDHQWQQPLGRGIQVCPRKCGDRGQWGPRGHLHWDPGGLARMVAQGMAVAASSEHLTPAV